ISATSRVSLTAASATGSVTAARYAPMPEASAWANSRTTGVRTKSARNTRLTPISAKRTNGGSLSPRRAVVSLIGGDHAVAEPAPQDVDQQQHAEGAEQCHHRDHRGTRVV